MVVSLRYCISNVQMTLGHWVKHWSMSVDFVVWWGVLTFGGGNTDKLAFMMANHMLAFWQWTRHVLAIVKIEITREMSWWKIYSHVTNCKFNSLIQNSQNYYKPSHVLSKHYFCLQVLFPRSFVIFICHLLVWIRLKNI